MNETFDRPNRPTGPREVWERESDGARLIVWDDGSHHNSLCFRLMVSVDCIGRVAHLPPDRYRICTIPDSPWPPKVRKEKRRVVQYRTPDGTQRVAYFQCVYNEFIPGHWSVISTEIRDCKIGEDGKVERVIPFKEGE